MPTEPNADRALTQDERDLLLYESRISRPVKMKLPEFEREQRLRHVLFSGQFTVDMLEDLAGTADKIRMLSKHRSGQDFLIKLFVIIMVPLQMQFM